MKINKSKKYCINFKNRIRVTFTFTIVAAIAFVLASLLITGFIYEEQQRQLETTKYRLLEIAEQDAAIVHNFFEDYIDTMRALAVYIKSSDDLTSAETIGFLRKMAESFGFERLSIDFPNGKSYTTDGIELNTELGEFAQSIESGQVFITNVANSNIDDVPVVCIQVPINKDGMTVASLGLSLKREYLNNMLKPLLSEKNKIFYIVDERGEYVAFDSGGNPLFSADINYFDSLDTFTYAKGSSKELIEQAFTDAKEGHMEFSLEGVERYGYYKPVGINNWVMLSITSKNAIDANTNRFLSNALTLSVEVLLIFLAAAVFVYLEQRKARKITELNEQCFRILAEHTNKVVLEWDYAKKIMYYPNFEKAIGQKPLKDSLGSADEAINAGAVHPDDSDIFRGMFASIMNGRAVENMRLRMRAADEAYKYYSISSVVVSDSKGKPYKSIGFLENIDAQIRKENYLYQKANTDQLTGLYNKAAAESLISEAIASSSDETTHALLCVDLDNFKGINDGFGHLYGDDVLKEIAGNIKKLFRASDIAGRFGGDEFVVFVRDIPNTDFAAGKAAELNKLLHKTYRKDNAACTVSASIGIAVFPTDGNTYEILYKKADEASYTVKKSGKNSYRFVADEENRQTVKKS